MLESIEAFLRAHPMLIQFLLVWFIIPIITGAFNYIFHQSPEDMEKLKETNPSLYGFLRFMKGMFPDPQKSREGLIKMITGLLKR